jgi:small-conductance mechanosensitive channel
MTEAQQVEVYWVLGLLAGVVLTAAIVNRFRPTSRPRLRRLVTVFVLYALATGLGIGFGTVDMPTWSGSLLATAELLRAFTIVSLAGTILFAVLLPSIGLNLPFIASDLIVGAGYVVTTLTVLSRHGLDPTQALVSGAVVSAVLAISLQNTIGNILGGVALQLDGSIHEGDWIQLENGKQGKVRAVRWRHTIVETRDWSTIVVPNAQLLNTSIIILGKRDGAAVPQRMWVYFDVDFRHAPSRVVRTVTDALLATPIDNVSSEPKPNVVCMDLGREGRTSVATYAVRYWLIDLAFDDPTNSRVRARIYTALRRAGIPLAIPTNRAFMEPQNEDRNRRRLAQEANERLAVLKTMPLFKTFTEEELHTLATGMTQSLYTAGERITRQGAVAHWLYLITSGTVEVRTNVDFDGAGPRDATPVPVAQITAPDFFGEMGLMTGAPRSADVIAVGDAECYLLGKQTFESVLVARPEIATELSKTLAERRLGLVAKQTGADPDAMKKHMASEAARILGGIKAFFGL